MDGVELKGLAELQAAIRERANTEAVKSVVKKHGASMQTRMQRNADFRMGYQTGATRRSIGLAMSFDGLTATVGPTTYYSPYLEWGTRYMSAQPFVGPAFDVEEVLFLNDLRKLVR
ncbi:MAG: HK97 gp10 family phage protein [Bacteroidales bacterium]|nr:HK97 gp10 family phage protein [Bacteroidales bacterium]